MSGVRHWRKMTWVLIAWVVLMIIWASSTSSSRSCKPVPGSAGFVQECSGGLNVGRWLAIAAGGFALLGLVWFMTKQAKRLCPACGQEVAQGLTQCPNCSHDFAAAAAGQPATASSPDAPDQPPG